jgi:hypothetical protein
MSGRFFVRIGAVALLTASAATVPIDAGLGAAACVAPIVEKGRTAVTRFAASAKPNGP